MTRQAHWLKENRANETPSHVVFFDTETKSVPVEGATVEARLWFGYGAYLRRHRGTSWTPPKWERISDYEEWWDWVESLSASKRKLYVIAHNMSFDMTVTKALTVLRSRGWELRGAIADDPPTVLRFRRDGATIVLMDSLNIFRMPLAQMGKYVGRDKLDFPAEEDSQETWETYCRRDVEVLIEAFQLWWSRVREWDLGNAQYTLPAQAFAAYRHRFMDSPIYIDDNPTALDMARESYSGGRTEAFQMGAIPGTVYCLDVNSMYPAVMRDLDGPTKLVTVVSRIKPDELRRWLDEYLLIADVTINTDLPMYPLKRDGRLIFPTGRYRTAMPTWELKEALSRDQVAQVHRVALYERGPLFKSYVSFFWDRRVQARAEGNESEAWLCKLLLNSLYGKFGQTGRIYDDIGETDSLEAKVWVEWDADTQTLRRYRQFAGLIQEEAREGESRDSHPAISAHVTSAARMLLWGFLESAGIDNVFYCDTDSLLVNEEGLGNLNQYCDDSQLGALKLEWQSNDVVIRGAKDYSIGDIRKIKGIRANAEEIRPGTFLQDVFRGFRGMLQAGDVDRQLITRKEKTLSRLYLKGTVLESGRVLAPQLP